MKALNITLGLGLLLSLGTSFGQTYNQTDVGVSGYTEAAFEYQGHKVFDSRNKHTPGVSSSVTIEYHLNDKKIPVTMKQGKNLIKVLHKKLVVASEALREEEEKREFEHDKIEAKLKGIKENLDHKAQSAAMDERNDKKKTFIKDFIAKTALESLSEEDKAAFTEKCKDEKDLEACLATEATALLESGGQLSSTIEAAKAKWDEEQASEGVSEEEMYGLESMSEDEAPATGEQADVIIDGIINDCDDCTRKEVDREILKELKKSQKENRADKKFFDKMKKAGKDGQKRAAHNDRLKKYRKKIAELSVERDFYVHLIEEYIDATPGLYLTAEDRKKLKDSEEVVNFDPANYKISYEKFLRIDEGLEDDIYTSNEPEYLYDLFRDNNYASRNEQNKQDVLVQMARINPDQKPATFHAHVIHARKVNHRVKHGEINKYKVKDYSAKHPKQAVVSLNISGKSVKTLREVPEYFDGSVGFDLKNKTTRRKFFERLSEVKPQ